MPRIMRRTSATEKAASYGYVDFLKDVVQKTVADTTAGFKRPTDFSDEEIMQMTFAGVGGGTKISKGLGKGKFPFNLRKTDFTTWDNILKRPAYHKKAKGLTAHVEFMSPREYYKIVEKGLDFKPTYEHRWIDFARTEDVKKYAEAMRKGAKFPMPGLEYQGKLIGQEGRHRILAAEKLGIDRVPVLVMRQLEKALEKKEWKMPITRPKLATAEEIPKEARAIVEKYKTQGLTYDAFVNVLPDSPEFAYHQWTFRGEGPLARATVTTKGTSLDEFEKMVADRIREFAKPMITAND